MVTVRGGIEVEESAQFALVGVGAGDGGVRVDDDGAVVHAEHARGVELDGDGGSLLQRTVDLEGDDVAGAGDGRHHVEENVELGEDGGVVHFDRLGRRVPTVLQVEARHLIAVEVRDDAASVAHAHVQHVVLVDVGDSDGASHVHGGGFGGAEVRRLHRRPRGVVEVHSVPVVSHLIQLLVQLPRVVLDLEGNGGGEHGGDRSHARRHLTHVDDHRTDIHRDVVTGGVVPAVLERVVQHQRVDVVVQAEVRVVQTARHGEGAVLADGRGGRVRAAEQLIRALAGPGVHAHHQRDQTLRARANLHTEREGGRGGFASVLLGGHGVHGRRALRTRRARDHTRVGVDGDAGGQRGRDGEVAVVHVRGVQLSHLDVLVDGGGGVRQLGHRHRGVVRRQVEGTELPRAVGGAGGDILETVLVPGLVVLDPDALLLADLRPRHARHRA